MFKKFVLLAVMTAAIPAYADLACQSSLDTLKSAMGNCSMGDQSSCDAVCSQLSPAAPAQAGGGCSGSDLENARSEGRQQMIQDLSVNATLTEQAFGVSEADCTSRVKLKLDALRGRVVDTCNQNTRFIHNCRVLRDAHISVAAASLPTVTGEGKVSMNKDSSDEATCRSTALAEAKQDALNKCKEASGFACTLSDDSTAIVRFKEEKPPIGKRKLKCDAQIQANPPSNVTTQCTAEMTAVNQVNGN